LQSYNITKTTKQQVIQHVRHEWIVKHQQAQHDLRYVRLLLHRAAISLYDIQHGYKTRREVKQLLCGTASCVPVPVKTKLRLDSIVSYVGAYNPHVNSSQQLESIARDHPLLFHPLQSSSPHAA